MSHQLSLLETPPVEVEDIWEKIHEYNPPRQYWQDLTIGEVCKNTTRWGDNRLCILTEIVEEVFGQIEYLEGGTAFLSLSCLVPASPEDLEVNADANH